jgi:hypothetical protein
LDLAVICSVFPTLILEIVQEIAGASILQLRPPLIVTNVRVPGRGVPIVTTMLANVFADVPLAEGAFCVTETIVGATGLTESELEREAALAGCIAPAKIANADRAVIVRIFKFFMWPPRPN